MRKFLLQTGCLKMANLRYVREITGILTGRPAKTSLIEASDFTIGHDLCILLRSTAPMEPL